MKNIEDQIIAFIFARGGSKGLPNKNIKILNGKPLIAWSIEHAKLAPSVDRIIVSTDSQRIAEVALSHGAEVPFIRPAELATDNSPEWLSWQHAVNYLKEVEGGMPKIMLSIPATAPLRKFTDIERALNEYKNCKCDVVVTITDAHRNPYFNMLIQEKSGHFRRVINTKIQYARRQDAPVVFDMTTVAYVTSPKFVIENSSIFEGKISGVFVPLERAIDIDTIFDFRIAEMAMQDN